MHALRRHPPRRLAAIARSLDRSGVLLLLATAVVVAAALFLAFMAVPAHAGATSRSLSGDYPVGSARRLEVGVPFGEVRVVGTDDARVRVRVKGSCDEGDFGAFLEDLRLESSNREGTLKVHLEGTKFQKTWNTQEKDDRDRAHGRRDRADRDGDGDIDITVVVEVPRSMQVDLNMGAGEVNVEGLRHDLSIDLGAGEISVRMMERHVGSVDVNMAVGETTIHQGGRVREYTRVLGGPVRWREGKGDAGIAVNIGAGEVDVTLE